MEDQSGKTATVRVLCKNLVISRNESDIQWLIGSPFFPSFTIVSTFRCIHFDLPAFSSPNLETESDDLRKLLPKGFDVIGALKVGNSNSEKDTSEAIAAARRLRKLLSGGDLDDEKTIGAVSDVKTGDVQFFVSKSEKSSRIEFISSVVYDDNPEKYVWEMGCLLHCELPVKLPFYYPAKKSSDAEKVFLHASETVLAKLKEPHVGFMFEAFGKVSGEVSKPVILRGRILDFGADPSNAKLLGDTAQDVEAKALSCTHFCLNSKSSPAIFSAENADKIQVTVMLNRSEKSPKFTAPIAEYLPATEEAQLVVVDFKLEVLCYALKDLPLMYAVPNLVVPALVDQLSSIKKMILPNLLTQHPQLRAYHFSPPGVLHPVTIIYELNYGETEMKQVDVRKSLHSRLGLPLDRPLLRIVNALDLSSKDDDSRRGNLTRRGSTLLKDVHVGIPSSGVSGGVYSLVQGSYDYHHYLQDGFDDSGWGCAYRSLQTIISWFRLQHYTSMDVPSHREIQQTLVDIGDKDTSFIGSHEWIGAIELSFVLDKLLGVSCKIMNVPSGSELPEKCRELAMHFKTQGTPIMIGGGVLAYTLLGVNYSEGSGDCAFLILDPHYTGSDDHRKIVNGGWVGWKKAVDSKGKSFFLHDKFYNLLLPQRPNMV